MPCLFPSSPTRVDGGQGEAVAFWDPQASTKKKWEETYATELQSRGLTQDFTGLSTLLLGQAQPAQFQTEGQTGYWWGSKVSDDGSWTALNEVANNANAEMPRSKVDDTYGAYMNWYAATAESGTYGMTRDNAEDSICPNGWRLPLGYQTIDWRNLVSAEYGITENIRDIDIFAKMKTLPLSIALSGIYASTDGRSRTGEGFSAGYISAAAAAGNGNMVSVTFNTSGYIYSYYANVWKIDGVTIRCIKSGNEA